MVVVVVVVVAVAVKSGRMIGDVDILCSCMVRVFIANGETEEPCKCK